jgi:hypothetical protein
VQKSGENDPYLSGIRIPGMFHAPRKYLILQHSFLYFDDFGPYCFDI